MKERPIPMATESVKAILDDRKTQTRRNIKLKGYSRDIWDKCVPHNGDQAALLGEPYLKVVYDPIVDNAGTRITCPFGQVGDRLWCKETWATDKLFDGMSAKQIEETLVATVPKWYKVGDDQLDNVHTTQGRWRSGRFMPKWAVRIWIEITEVRVERLQEITLEDCKAEGIHGYTFARACLSDNPPDPRWKFIDLWDSLNAKRGQWHLWEDDEEIIHREFVKVDYSWEVNPWVWVIGFKREELK